MLAMLGERPALDFLATVAERGTTDDEYLRRPADLAAWAVQAGILTRSVGVTSRQLVDAIALREAMYRLVSAVIDGAPTSPVDRELLNAAAQSPPPVPHLTRSGSVTRSGPIDAVLAVVAADCIDLFDHPDRYLLRRCDDPTCTRLYLDRSRGRRRRWCEMKSCGDRAKAAAYRQRQHEDTNASAPATEPPGF